MSVFVHGKERMNQLVKFLILEMDKDRYEAIKIVTEMHMYNTLSFGFRYDETPKLNLEFYRGEKFDALRLLNPIEILKLLDSIEYQCEEYTPILKQVELLLHDIREEIINNFIDINVIRTLPEYDKADTWI